MLIPFGILSSAGEEPVEAASYEHIATVFGDGSSGSITFSSIPADYKHLQIRTMTKSSTTDAIARMQFNGITTNTYFSHFARGQLGVRSSGNVTSANGINLLNFDALSSTANSFAAGIYDILDYTSTTKTKTVRAISGSVDNNSRAMLDTGSSTATSPITSITFFKTTAANFTATSRFSIYGIRG